MPSNAAKKILLTMAVILLLAACGGKSETQTWQEAYTALLLEYAAATAHLEPEEGWRFTLHDISGSGTPELIVWSGALNDMDFVFLWNEAYAVYTFADGEARRLVLAESFGSHPSGLGVFPAPDGAAGMLVRNITLGTHWLLRTDGISLYVEAYGIIMRADPSDELMFQINYAFVDEDEFYAVFGFMKEDDMVQTHQLTETSVLNVFSGR